MSVPGSLTANKVMTHLSRSTSLRLAEVFWACQPCQERDSHARTTRFLHHTFQKSFCTKVNFVHHQCTNQCQQQQEPEEQQSLALKKGKLLTHMTNQHRSWQEKERRDYKMSQLSPVVIFRENKMQGKHRYSPAQHFLCIGQFLENKNKS